MMSRHLVVAIALLACGACDRSSDNEPPPPVPAAMLPQPVTNADGAPPPVPFDPATPRTRVIALGSAPHDTAAYTQGLIVEGTRLIESTGLEGKSDVREVDRATGKTRKRTPIPAREFGEGIAAVQGRIYHLTWKGGRGHVYDATSLAVVDSFTYQGEGWGLATDGTALYMSDGSSHIRVIAPQGFAQQRTIDVTEGGRPVPMLNELEWVNGQLWANIYQTDFIARIDPATGHVVGWVDTGGLLTSAEREGVRSRGGTANGIAYDAARQRVLLTGKLWPRLFEVAVP